MLATANGEETDERNLHTRKRTQSVPRSVANVQPWAVSSHTDENESVQRQQVGNEDITTPRRHHVSIEQGSAGAPEHGSVLDSLDPEVKGKDEEEDGNGLVVITSCHGSRNVTRRDAHEGGREQASGGRRDHFRGQEVCSKRSEAGEGGRKEDTDVANVNGEGNGAEEVVNDAAGNHESGVESTTSNSSQRMPCSYMPLLVQAISRSSRAWGTEKRTVIEPVPEAVEAILNEVLGGPEVKPGIDYINSSV